MATIFDTKSNDPRFRSPPRGKCHVCTEGPSTIEPKDSDARSHTLIGMWMDANAAREHAKQAQETYGTKATVVAFDFTGKEIYRGQPHAMTAAKPGKAA